MQSEQFQKKLRELVIEVPLTFDTGRSLDRIRACLICRRP